MKKIILILSIFLVTNFCRADVLSARIESADFLYGASDFVIAIVEGNNKKVEEYLKLGANPNEKYSNIPVIFFGAHFRYDDIMSLLLKYGANPDITTYGVSILQYSICRECLNCTKELIEYGADVNKKGKLTQSPLNTALSLKNKKIASILLRAGATPNKKSYKMMKKLEY